MKRSAKWFGNRYPPFGINLIVMPADEESHPSPRLTHVLPAYAGMPDRWFPGRPDPPGWLCARNKSHAQLIRLLPLIHNRKLGKDGISWYYMGVNEIKVTPKELTKGFKPGKNCGYTSKY